MKTKTLLAVGLLALGLSTLNLNAAAILHPQVTLAWDGSPDEGDPTLPPVAYILTAWRMNAGVLEQVDTNCGTNHTADVYALAGGNWTFYVVAKFGPFYSGPSNSLDVRLPKPAANIRIPAVTAPAGVTRVAPTLIPKAGVPKAADSKE